MSKLFLFLLVVFMGVFGYLVFSNQAVKSNSPFAPSPTNILTPGPTNFLSLSPTGVANTTKAPLPTASVQQSPISSATATIKTSKGDIILTLYPKDAPNTVNNFINKAKSGYYNGLIFHRVENWVIQGGDPLGNGTGGGNMKTELNSQPFVTGSLGVARGGDINVSNDSQFFITKSDASWLNGQYTNFGIVTKGMDVVNQIQIGDKILGITVEEQ